MWKGAEDLSDLILFLSSRAHGWTTLDAMPRYIRSIERNLSCNDNTPMPVCTHRGLDRDRKVIVKRETSCVCQRNTAFLQCAKETSGVRPVLYLCFQRVINMNTTRARGTKWKSVGAAPWDTIDAPLTCYSVNGSKSNQSTIKVNGRPTR
jgi:hypothetical protein